MFGMRMALGGEMGRPFEDALGRVLGGMGYAVAARMETRTREDYYRWLTSPGHVGAPRDRSSYWEPPSLLVYPGGRVRNGPRWVLVEVRNIRAPASILRLTRSLSGVLGGFGVAYVDDRLHDDYGYGAFFAGRTLEAAARSIAKLVLRVGFDPRCSDAALFADCDEDMNASRHRRYLRALDGDASWDIPRSPDAPLEAFALAETPERAMDPPPEPAFVRAVIAGGDAKRMLGIVERPPPGFRACLDLAWPIHDECELDPETYEPVEVMPRGYLDLVGPPGADPAHILACAEELEGAAVAVELRGRDEPFRSWSRGADGARREGEAYGAAAFFEAFAPVCALLGTGPAQFCWPWGPSSVGMP